MEEQEKVDVVEEKVEEAVVEAVEPTPETVEEVTEPTPETVEEVTEPTPEVEAEGAEVEEAVVVAKNNPIHMAWIGLKKALENGLTGGKKSFCFTIGDGGIIIQAWTPNGTSSVSSKCCGTADEAVKDLNSK